MPQKLTDKLVKALPAPKPRPPKKRPEDPPAPTNAITYDSEVTGFGVRVTSAGARAFILNYRTGSGRERRYTIGSPPEWNVAAARAEAARLRYLIDKPVDKTKGERPFDPLDNRQADREAPTVADLCKRFDDEHLPRKRASTVRDYRASIDNHILPAMKHLKVVDVTYSDVDGLHRKITKAGSPYQANRVVAVLSKMFSLAIRWRMRADNPVKGIERNQEQKRRRYLTAEEIARLTRALAELEDQQAANIIRLLLLTGSRRGEMQSARWEDIDLKKGVWTKPGATTKQKTEHEVPLSAPARQLLTDLHEAAAGNAEYVFPGRSGGHRVELKDAWVVICKAAKISGARVHDLRHTYASILASGGASLPLIGALLGHTQPATTARYAHLFDDPLRAATETVGAILAGHSSAEVVPLRGGKAAS